METIGSLFLIKEMYFNSLEQHVLSGKKILIFFLSMKHLLNMVGKFFDDVV